MQPVAVGIALAFVTLTLAGPADAGDAPPTSAIKCTILLPSMRRIGDWIDPDTTNFGVWVFVPEGTQSDDGYFYGYLSFAGICTLVQAIVQCIINAIETVSPIYDCFDDGIPPLSSPRFPNLDPNVELTEFLPTAPVYAEYRFRVHA